MGEYETASLAIQEAALALQQQGLWAAYIQAGAALLVGLAQCGLIAWGIEKMDASNQRRERQEVQAETRHEETMLALQQQGEYLKQQGEALRTSNTETMLALQQQGEALKQQGEALRTSNAETMLALQQQGEALKQQGEALRTLIERTAPQK